MQKQPTHVTDVAIVGGGLAGLTAAAYLARAGRSVTLFERSRDLGGRARTQQYGDFAFNLGPHALYTAGAGTRVLQELGVVFQAAKPPTAGYAIRDGELHTLPAGPASLFTTGLFGLRDRIEALRLLAALPRIDTDALQTVTVRDWLDREIERPAVREFFAALLRLFTYANAPERQSAGTAIARAKLALSDNVLYVDGGWQTLVDGLQRVAETAGVHIVTGTRVERVVWDQVRGARGVRLADGTTHDAAAVLIAAAPNTVASLTDDAVGREWADAAMPIEAACLDVGLAELPDPDASFALGIDRPLYFSVHSAVADLAPPGAAMIHVAKYLPAGRATDPDADEHELETVLDLVQPGWRELLVERRFLPRMTVANAVTTAAGGGLPGRPGPEVRGVRGLYVAGDWVGHEGLLSDAGFASAKRAAELIVQADRSVQYEAALQLQSA